MSEHPAVENLRKHQTQLDEDGVMIGVSRQAVGETLVELARLRADNERLGNIINSASEDYDRLRRVNAELVESIKDLLHNAEIPHHRENARIALRSATEPNAAAPASWRAAKVERDSGWPDAATETKGEPADPTPGVRFATGSKAEADRRTWPAPETKGEPT